MRLLDIFLLILLGWGGYSGFRKGLILEIFSVGALVLAALGSIRLLDGAVALCTKWYDDQREWLPYVAFVLLFFIIFVTITWAGKFLKNLIKQECSHAASSVGTITPAACTSIPAHMYMRKLQ